MESFSEVLYFRTRRPFYHKDFKLWTRPLDTASPVAFSYWLSKIVQEVSNSSSILPVRCTQIFIDLVQVVIVQFKRTPLHNEEPCGV